MIPVTLGVLLCDSVDPSRLSIAGNYQQIFTDLFRDFEPPEFEVVLRFYDVVAGVYPTRLEECDGYLTTGASASVNDPMPWIGDFEEFVRTLHASDTRLFAICFGHQMIAKALGGRVERSSHGWSVGVQEVTITQPELWMNPPLPSYQVACSHQDQVTTLPPDAVVLGANSHCPVSLFRCGSLVGIQGHPEFSVDYARALLDSRRDIIPAETVRAAEESFATEPDHAALVSWIVNYLSSGAA